MCSCIFSSRRGGRWNGDRCRLTPNCSSAATRSPSLKAASLYQGRDLMPTTDLRAVIKGVLADHLGLSERVLAETVFPDSAAARPMKGLVA